jgi:hypothetical protein
MAERFRSALTQADLISAATVTCTAGVPVQLGHRKIEAGEMIAIGYGQQSGQESAQGRVYMDLRDSSASPGAVMKGLVRLQAYSPQGRPIRILGEWRSEVLATGKDDRTKQVPLPEDIYYLPEDRKLVLEFIADATQTLGKTNSSIYLDTTTETV